MAELNTGSVAHGRDLWCQSIFYALNEFQRKASDC